MAGLCTNSSAQQPIAERFFTEKVEPVLREHCFKCHSHAHEISGGLTLDSRSGWEVGGDHGPAIVPGKSSASLLIKAILRTDADLQMPPDERLPEEAIEIFVKWIELGAPDPRTAVPLKKDSVDPLDWWSLRPLVRPAVPATDALGTDAENPIDAFVLRKLGEARLAPAPKADRRTLIRRVYFDLHGLPPTPDEVTAFVDDPDPRAYENLVNRLLDSPRYGERWARHWLDTVHFADSHGCEHDVFRPNAWRYRDYVIDALNEDTSWSTFIRQQLAADQLYPNQPQLMAALGFIAAGPLELSRARTAPVTFDYLDRDDMITQTMAAFTSTTANCARCHDHKFDPISQDDYYSLQAVFAGIGKGDVEFDVNAQVAAKRQHFSDLLAAVKRKDIATLSDPANVAVIQQWESSRDNTAVWQPLTPSTFLSAGGATLRRLDDNSVLATEPRPEQDTYTITAPTSLSQLTALRLEVLRDESLPMKGPGRADNGNLHLSEWEAFVFDPHSPTQISLKFRGAVADWDQDEWTIAHALDGNVKTAWGIYPKVGESHHAVFELAQPLTLRPSSQIVVVLKQLHGGSHLIGRVKLYATDAPNAAAEVVPDVVASALAIARNDRTSEQQIAINVFALQRHAEQQLATLPEKASVYAVSNRYSHAKKLDAPQVPKIVHVLERGDIDKPGAIATAGAIAAIPKLAGRFELAESDNEGARRAALAEWLSADANPLTWRSVVNRVWHHHFGRGLCDTPNDFGRMGSKPSHPELLDWLAVWFRDDAGGSLKELHRLILYSSTYQRRSGVSSDDSVDPENRLLWRGNLRELDAEAYRDSVLQLSGRIDLTMGGPGIQQFTQSKGAQATPKLNYDAFDWNDSTAARRSIYRVVWRGIADPFMESLNFPDLGLLAPKREASVSAIQSLALYNNDFVLHHCDVLARKLQAEHESNDEQTRQVCRLVYLRDPNANELSDLTEYTEKHGLAATCRILLNSNAFLFVE